jgi:hypothetical protein
MVVPVFFMRGMLADLPNMNWLLRMVSQHSKRHDAGREVPPGFENERTDRNDRN